MKNSSVVHVLLVAVGIVVITADRGRSGERMAQQHSLNPRDITDRRGVEDFYPPQAQWLIIPLKSRAARTTTFTPTTTTTTEAPTTTTRATRATRNYETIKKKTDKLFRNDAKKYRGRAARP